MKLLCSFLDPNFSFFQISLFFLFLIFQASLFQVPLLSFFYQQFLVPIFSFVQQFLIIQALFVSMLPFLYDFFLIQLSLLLVFSNLYEIVFKGRREEKRERKRERNSRARIDSTEPRSCKKGTRMKLDTRSVIPFSATKC